jgi:hypothetical protein
MEAWVLDLGGCLFPPFHFLGAFLALDVGPLFGPLFVFLHFPSGLVLFL